MVCKLNQVIYGLRQAGHEWYEHLCGIMFSISFTRCQVAHAVFHQTTKEGSLIVAVDVDNMMMVRSTKTVIQHFTDELSKYVSIKNLGDLHFLLGIEVTQDHNKCTISFSQKAYIEKVLKRFNMTDAKSISTPLDPNTQLSIAQYPSTPEEYADMCNIPYREAVGSLMYLAIGTCLDITFTVVFLSQFLQNLG